MVVMYGIKNCDTIKKPAAGWKHTTSTIASTITVPTGLTRVPPFRHQRTGMGSATEYSRDHGENWMNLSGPRSTTPTAQPN